MFDSKRNLYIYQSIQKISSDVSGYKKKFLFSYIRDQEKFVYLCFIIVNVYLFSGFYANFKLICGIFLILALILWLRLKNLLVSISLVCFYTLPLFNPNKYYSIEVIRATDILDHLIGYREGYYLGYGLNIGNIFLILSMLTLFRIIFLVRRNIRLPKLLLFSAAVFLSLGLFASSRHSPFFVTSLIWLLQYCSMFVIAILIYYFYRYSYAKVNLLFVVILMSLWLQIILGIWQFVKQSPIGLSIEFATEKSFFAYGLDENNSLFRISGTFVYHNQLALITLIYIILLLPYGLDRNKPLFITSCFIGYIIIILTQSRSIWIASFFVFVYIYIRNREKVILYIKKHVRPLVFIFLQCGLVIIPRVFLSFNSFYEGAGIPFRIKLLSEASQALLQNPWFGYGVGTNEYVLQKLFPNGVMSVFPSAVHQGFFQLALEVGVLGLVAFILPIVAVLREIFATNIRNLDNYGTSFILGVFAFFMYYLFQPHVGIIEFQFLGCILGFGIIATHAKDKKNI